MTLPAFSINLFLTGKIMIPVAVGPDGSGHHGMAGDAIGLNPFRRVIADLDPLGIGIHGKSTGMVPAVPHLGQILVNNTSSWKMTLDTGDAPGMGTVLPGRIGGIHDMTVDAGLGVWRKIRQGLRYIHHIDEQTDRNGKGRDGTVFE